MTAATLSSPSTRSRFPGFGLSLGFTIFYLSAIVLVPLLALVLRPFEFHLQDFWTAISSPRVLASLRLSFGAALVAAVIDTVFGFIIAWVLVRYRFPGKRLMDALIDLPFALPTAVAGIALSTLYAPTGWIGGILARHKASFPNIPLATVDGDFGGWAKAQQTHFGDGGVFDQIYQPGK